jgi:hypothetical protein
MQVNTPITSAIWNRKVVSDAIPTDIKLPKGKPSQETAKYAIRLLRKAQPATFQMHILMQRFNSFIQPVSAKNGKQSSVRIVTTNYIKLSVFIS